MGANYATVITPQAQLDAEAAERRKVASRRRAQVYGNAPVSSGVGYFLDDVEYPEVEPEDDTSTSPPVTPAKRVRCNATFQAVCDAYEAMLSDDEPFPEKWADVLAERFGVGRSTVCKVTRTLRQTHIPPTPKPRYVPRPRDTPAQALRRYHELRPFESKASIVHQLSKEFRVATKTVYTWIAMERKYAQEGEQMIANQVDVAEYETLAPISEHDHQAQLFMWVERLVMIYPELRLLHAIPNGGFRGKATAGKMKREGVKSGVPDMCLPVARQGWHGLYIELKIGKNTLRDTQKEWLEALTKQGYLAVCCYGWKDASDVLRDYLGIDLPR